MTVGTRGMHRAGLVTLAALVGCADARSPADLVSQATDSKSESGPAVAAPMIGVLVTRTGVMVAAELETRVNEIVVRSGQRVHKGDVLANLDTEILENKLRAAKAREAEVQATAEAARAYLAAARSELNANRMLVELRGADPRSLQASHKQVEQAVESAARTAHDADTLAVARAVMTNELEAATVVAPISGIAFVKSKPGDFLKVGDAMVWIADSDEPIVRFQVLHELRSSVDVGTLVDVTGEGIGGSIRARVTAVSAELEPPLSFAIAEAGLVEAGIAQLTLGTRVDVRIAAAP